MKRARTPVKLGGDDQRPSDLDTGDRDIPWPVAEWGRSTPMNYEGIAALLYAAYQRNSVDVEQQPWDDLYADEQLPWIAVAKEAHRVIAAAVLA